MSSHLNISKCPICQNKIQKFSNSIRTLVNYNIIELKFGYCKLCDFAFMINPFDEESMQNYYSQSNQLRRSCLTEQEKAHIIDQIGFIESNIKHFGIKNILEIGADSGGFLELARNEFNAVGFFEELNPDARKILISKGFLNSLKEEYHDVSYDLIVLRHVLEHIVDPLSYLKKITLKLNSIGYIFIEVPDCSSLILNEYDPFQLEHVNYFSILSIVRLTQQTTLSICNIKITKTEGYSVTPNRVLRILFNKCDTQRTNYQDFNLWSKKMFSSNETIQLIDKYFGLNKGRKIALYGAGTKTLEYFVNTSIETDMINKIYDKDQKKIGNVIFSLEIIDAEVIQPNDFDLILVMVVGYEKEVLDFLHKKNISDDKIITMSKLKAKLKEKNHAN